MILHCLCIIAILVLHGKFAPVCVLAVLKLDNEKLSIMTKLQLEISPFASCL